MKGINQGTWILLPHTGLIPTNNERWQNELQIVDKGGMRSEGKGKGCECVKSATGKFQAYRSE